MIMNLTVTPNSEIILPSAEMSSSTITSRFTVHRLLEVVCNNSPEAVNLFHLRKPGYKAADGLETPTESSPTSTSNNLSSHVRRQVHCLHIKPPAGLWVSAPTSVPRSLRCALQRSKALVEEQQSSGIQLMVSSRMHVDIQWVYIENKFGKSQSRDTVFSLPTGWQSSWREREREREELGTVYHIGGTLPSKLYCSNREGTVTYISETHSNPASLTHTHKAHNPIHKAAAATPDPLCRQDCNANPSKVVWPNPYG